MSTCKIALVTGGSRGLGKNAAQHLAQTGRDVLLTYHRHPDEAEAVVAAIRTTGRTAALLLDTSNVGSFDALFEQVRATLHATFGTDTFDFLVNNAGTDLS